MADEKSKLYYESHKAEVKARTGAYSWTRRRGPEGEHMRALERAQYQRSRMDPEWAARRRSERKDRSRRLRAEMLAAYGNACACCDETREPFLTLDHVNGGGEQHRMAMKGHDKMLRSIKREGWPKDKYRLLCMNCNFATRGGQTCPHVVAQVENMLIEAFCS